MHAGDVDVVLDHVPHDFDVVLIQSDHQRRFSLY
jgi:hypothetical protein